MTAAERKLVQATPQTYCPACQRKAVHDPMSWSFHRFAGHGFTLESGWTHADLKPRSK